MREVVDYGWTGGSFTPRRATHTVTKVVEHTSEQIVDVVEGIPLHPFNDTPNMPDLLVCTFISKHQEALLGERLGY